MSQGEVSVALLAGIDALSLSLVKLFGNQDIFQSYLLCRHDASPLFLFMSERLSLLVKPLSAENKKNNSDLLQA
jgi:hypothetical protein